MNVNVYIGAGRGAPPERVGLTRAAMIGEGGEAEVYDLGDGRVVKRWKPVDHGDYAGLPHAQAAAAARLRTYPVKLRALPSGLPAAVVVPTALVYATKRAAVAAAAAGAGAGAGAAAAGAGAAAAGAAGAVGDVVGYVMPRVVGEPLHGVGEPRWHRANPRRGGDLVATLLALHDAIAGLHARGVIVGDCNDLNILVEVAARRVHLIDVDSYQLPGHACEMFSERFVDPRLCDATLSPIRPHDAASDWFAFAAIALRTLLQVGPWGGVHRGCPGVAQRALRRLSVLGAGITYPRAARPIAALPDDLIALFRDIFEGDRRTLPRDALAGLVLRACAQCGDEHARTHCPSCRARAPVSPTVVHGKLRWSSIAVGAVAIATREVTGDERPGVWLEGGALYRRGRLGRERIGGVLAGQTRAWVGARLGVGFYRAGGYQVGFVFRPDRGPLDDGVALPAIRGQLVAADATIGDDHAWLWLTTADSGRLVTTAVVVGADGRILACEPVDAPWLAGVAGACAVGTQLFVPTDDGIVRIDLVAPPATATPAHAATTTTTATAPASTTAAAASNPITAIQPGARAAIVQTRAFAETAPLVGAGDRLALAPSLHGGLDVARRRDAIRLQLT